jgi:hypothetical protein
MNIRLHLIVLAAVPILVPSAGVESRADLVYTYTTLVEITSPFPVGLDAAVGESFGHLNEGLGNGTLQMEGHNSPAGSTLSGFQLIDIADVGIASNRPTTIPADTGFFDYLIEVMVTSNGQTRTFDVTGTIDVTAANTAVAQSTGSFLGVTPVLQPIGGTDLQMFLTGPGTGYTGPTIDTVPLTGHIVVGISPVGANAVPEPSSLVLAVGAASIAGGRWGLRRQFGAFS